jgi:hypothetical protein
MGLSATSTAYDVSIADSLTGTTITGQDAYATYRAKMLFGYDAANTTCTSVQGTRSFLGNCMNWMWHIVPVVTQVLTPPTNNNGAQGFIKGIFK